MQMSSIDPKGASEWAASLPAEVRRGAIEPAVAAWTQSNPETAGQWLNTLAGPARDEAASAYSSHVAVKDPVTALSWATSISDATIRDRSVDRIVTGWIRRNPNEATAWIRNSTLADADKKRLLATPAEPPGR